MCRTYERRKTEDGAKIIMVKKNHHDATTFDGTTFNITVDSTVV